MFEKRKEPTYKATIYCTYRNTSPLESNLENLDIEPLINSRDPEKRNYNLIVITKETEKKGIIPIITIYDKNKWIKETTPNKQTKLTSTKGNTIIIKGDPINLSCENKEEIIKTTNITLGILQPKQNGKKLKRTKPIP